MVGVSARRQGVLRAERVAGGAGEALRAQGFTGAGPSRTPTEPERLRSDSTTSETTAALSSNRDARSRLSPAARTSPRRRSPGCCTRRSGWSGKPYRTIGDRSVNRCETWDKMRARRSEASPGASSVSKPSRARLCGRRRRGRRRGRVTGTARARLTRGIRRETYPNSVRVLTFTKVDLVVDLRLARSGRGYSGLLSTLEASRSIASRASFGTCGFKPNARIPLKHASNPRNASAGPVNVWL